MIPAVEDLVQEVGAAGVEAEMAELIYEEQLVGGPGGEATVQTVAGLGRDEVVDEVGGGNEADAVTAQASELADGVGEMGLADAGGPNKHCAAVSEDLQHICVRSCAPPNIIELFGIQPTTAGDAAVMTMRAISGFSG